MQKLNITNQQGGSLLSFLFWALAIGLIVLSSVRLAPGYYEYWKIASTIQSLSSVPNISEMSRPQVIRMLQKRFLINSISPDRVKSITIKKENQSFNMHIDYEQRVDFIGNIDAVLMFNRKFEVTSQ